MFVIVELISGSFIEINDFQYLSYRDISGIRKVPAADIDTFMLDNNRNYTIVGDETVALQGAQIRFIKFDKQ